MAVIIEQFLDGTGGRWDWDDFVSLRIEDPELDAIRLRCARLQDEILTRVIIAGQSGSK